MSEKYNSTYFDSARDVLHYHKGGELHKSLQVFHLADGTLLGMFQGNRGDRPDLDFVIKFLTPGPCKKLRTPKNLHWVVDILMIGKADPAGALKLTRSLLECYQGAQAFKSARARNAFQPEKAQKIAQEFQHLDKKGAVSVAFVTHIVELFSICEKASPRDTKMFENLLLVLVDYFDGRKDYYQVLNATTPGYG